MGLFGAIMLPLFQYLNMYKWYFVIAIALYIILTIVFRHSRPVITIIFGAILLFFILTHIGGMYDALKTIFSGVGTNSQIVLEEYSGYINDNIVTKEEYSLSEKVERALSYSITGKETTLEDEKLPTSEELDLSGTLDYVSNGGGDRSEEEGAFSRLVAKVRDFFVGMWNELRSMFGIKTQDKVPDDEIPETETGIAQVHFIDVGQADCTLITDGEDAMLIDCGNYADITVVEEYLTGLGIETIDYFVLTHPHEDHIGCAAQIMKDYSIENVVMPDVAADTACYTAMQSQINKQNIPVDYATVDATYTFGDGEFTVLGPLSKDTNELNNNSVVLRYEYGDISFLFSGDAEAEEETEILESGAELASTVYKVGHHGSESSSTNAWLNAIQPQYAVIPVGVDNSYGHPDWKIVSRLHEYTDNVYRTDENGTVVFTTDGTRVNVDVTKAA